MRTQAQSHQSLMEEAAARKMRMDGYLPSSSRPLTKHQPRIRTVSL